MISPPTPKATSMATSLFPTPVGPRMITSLGFMKVLNRCGLIPRSLLRNGDSKSSQGLSFPHAFSGNPGETRTRPPIKTFGGDDFGENYHKVFRYPAACCMLRDSSFYTAYRILSII